MNWPEERRDDDEYPGRYRQAAGAFISRYKDASWRKKAVACVREAIENRLAQAKKTDEPPSSPSVEQLRERLGGAECYDAAEQLSLDDVHNGISLAGALLAEAAGTVFCNRAGVARWQMVGRIIENDPIARTVLAGLVEERMVDGPRLRHDIRKVARKLVQQFVKDPVGLTRRGEESILAEMHREWAAKPDLQEIWFGLRANQYILPFRSDWYIFDLLFEVDTAFAAELIEEYGAPFQPAMILSFGALNPRLRHWERLMQFARPAFEPDGAWNGRILLPLLLRTAQDAMRSGVGRFDEGESATERRDAQFEQLAEAVASIIWARPDGCATALRWSAWLFRSIMSTLDGERASYPMGSSSRARPAWQTIEALVRREGSIAWRDLRPTDVASADELCLEAVRILAAQEHGQPTPGRELLFQMLPLEAEQFLEGDRGARVRELPSLFMTWGKRADAFGTRILATALFDEDVAATFAKLWNCTLVLREITEHGHAFQLDDGDYDDRVRRASETIRFVISLGINLIDCLQDERQTAQLPNRHTATLALSSTMHDATREMLAIDPIGRRDMEHIHNHLCVRRLVYEASHPRRAALAAPLSETDLPTAGDLLFERCEVSPSFFNCLQMLLANGITRERIERALQSVGIRLDELVEQARRLNSIEHMRTIDLTDL